MGASVKYRRKQKMPAEALAAQKRQNEMKPDKQLKNMKLHVVGDTGLASVYGHAMEATVPVSLSFPSVLPSSSAQRRARRWLAQRNSNRVLHPQ